MTIAKLVAKAKVWVGRSHAGETQHGHHGISMGSDAGGYSLSVSAEASSIWINVQGPDYIDGPAKLPEEIIKQVREAFIKLKLSTHSEWYCRSQGHPSYSWLGTGWKIHPDSVELCEPISLGAQSKTL